MKILILSGEVNCQRPFSYGITSDWETKIISVVDTDLDALVQKYEGSQNVPLLDTVPLIKEAINRSVLEMDTYDPDVVIGVGIGANSLISARAGREWLGPCVFIDPIVPVRLFPMSRDPDPHESGDLGRVTWVLTDGSHFTRTHATLKRLSFFKNAELIASLKGNDSLETFYSSGGLSSLIRIIA